MLDARLVGARGGVVLMLFLLLTQGAAAACEPRLGEADPAGDTEPWVDVLPHDEGAVDFTSIALTRTGELVVYEMTLVDAPPVTPGSEQYRYWLNFHAMTSDGTLHDFDLRVVTEEDSPRYTAHLIHEGEIADRLGTFPVAWTGTTATVAFPLSAIEKYLHTEATVGSIGALSDGPHRLPGSTTSIRDKVGPPSLEQADGFRAVPECGDGSPDVAPRAIPLPPTLVLALAVAAVGARHRMKR